MSLYHQLCVELADDLERYRPLSEVPPALQRARQLLGPTPIPLSDLGLPTAVSNALRRAGCQTIQDAAALAPERLETIKRLGRGGRQLLHEALSRWYQASAQS